MTRMPNPPPPDTPVPFDTAVRACELLFSYFALTGLLYKSIEADSVVTRLGLRDLLTPLHGTPESELRRKLQAVHGKIRLKAKATESQAREFLKLKETVRRYAEGK